MTFRLLVALALASAGCSSRVASDAGAPSDAPSLDASAHDAAPDDAASDDAGPDDAGPDARIEPRDAGPDARVAIDGGRDAGPIDAGADSAVLRIDTGPPSIDAGMSIADSGSDAPAADAGAIYVLGEPLANCDATCAAIGRTCGGEGSVGLDCRQHMELPSCLDPTMWIYRAHPSEPMRCLGAWGTSDVCSNNYNVYNSFCCRCE